MGSEMSRSVHYKHRSKMNIPSVRFIPLYKQCAGG